MDVFVALGANLDDPAAQVEQAIAELARLPRTRLTARSSLYLSKAEGYAAQPDFVNAVAALSTTLAPRALLAALLEIETRHGRRREFKNAPRTLDLDLLLYDGLILHEPGLTLPHPRMCQRAFVLQPMAEIAPRQAIPGRGSVVECLAQLPAVPLPRLPNANHPLSSSPSTACGRGELRVSLSRRSR
jgi:2-amino-4-hydroxy-6-hydroxymethyldihydropteridine diphosphokinase